MNEYTVLTHLLANNIMTQRRDYLENVHSYAKSTYVAKILLKIYYVPWQVSFKHSFYNMLS